MQQKNAEKIGGKFWRLVKLHHDSELEVKAPPPTSVNRRF